MTMRQVVRRHIRRFEKEHKVLKYVFRNRDHTMVPVWSKSLLVYRYRNSLHTMRDLLIVRKMLNYRDRHESVLTMDPGFCARFMDFEWISDLLVRTGLPETHAKIFIEEMVNRNEPMV